MKLTNTFYLMEQSILPQTETMSSTCILFPSPTEWLVGELGTSPTLHLSGMHLIKFKIQVWDLSIPDDIFSANQCLPTESENC